MTMPLQPMRFATFVLALLSGALSASTFDNEAGRYRLTALPDAVAEAERMDRMQLCDQQPAGRHVRKNERITITVGDLPDGYTLDALIGFQPMWGSQLDQQEEQLDAGETQFRADQDGPLYFRFIAPDGADARRASVSISVDGGRPLPLYVDGTMSAKDWTRELAAHADAPFVQLLGNQALITLPTPVHEADPIIDPRATFAAIDDVIDLENELAGFDGGTRRDQPTPLRVHYLVDFRASKRDRENFYMYATDQFIGMLDDNTSDLTDPEKLRREWGIWHETGHTQQQNSWTWDALGEVNVNLFSLYVQEKFGVENTLARSEDGEPSFFDKARDYLAHGAGNLLIDVDEDDNGDGFFIRLVLFYQLQQVYGWDLYKDLHKHFRAHPQAENASDQDKADALVLALCTLTDVDLREFFARWGLRTSPAADRKLDAEGYELPDRDFSEILE